MTHGFGGHQELELVHSGGLMELGAFDAGLRVSGHDYAPVRHGLGVEFLPDLLGQCPAA